MMRSSALIVCSCILVMSGCGQDSETSKNDSETPASAESSSGTQTDAAQDELSAPELIRDPEVVELEDMVSDVAKLMATAHEAESDFDYEQALETWKEIESKVSDQYGRNSWQATNAKLAIEAAQFRSSLDFEERKILYEIGDLELSIERDLENQDAYVLLSSRAQICSLVRRLWGPDSHVLAGHLFKQAQAHQAIGQYPEAETLMQRALEIREQVMGKVHPEYIHVLHALAILYQQQNAHDLAMPPMVESVELCELVWGDESKPLATYLNDLGVLQYTVSDFDSAKVTLEGALTRYEQSGFKDSFDFAHCLFNLASVYLADGSLDSAEAAFRDSLARFLTARSADHEMVQQTRTQLATVLLLKNQVVEAEGLLADVVDSRKRTQGDFHPAYAKSLFQLGVAYGKQGKYDLAEPTLREAYSLQRQMLRESDQDVIRTADALVTVLRRQGLDREADALETQTRVAAQQNQTLQR